ncbi:helix-turn-helix domain-containing protein [Embleya sp. NBC_00888]|uniref:helix-turn-helix domain-containing protein n=1 Tax=Embleya sp. NBC_00888 TaxID=2975960 RepID=UPI00386EC738|nr:helix-turn-helix domain-containing protein [Embleya sp. NBC_00888]
MHPEQYRIVDGDLLHRLMRRPPSGTRLTVRDLADLLGLSKSKISGMITGTRPVVTAETAEQTCLILGVHRAALFLPVLSTSLDMDSHSERSVRHDAGQARSSR